jgi:hypothetical protein
MAPAAASANLEGLLGHRQQGGLHDEVAGGEAPWQAVHQPLKQLLQRRQLREQLRGRQVAHFALRGRCAIRLLERCQQQGRLQLQRTILSMSLTCHNRYDVNNRLIGRLPVLVAGTVEAV